MTSAVNTVSQGYELESVGAVLDLMIRERLSDEMRFEPGPVCQEKAIHEKKGRRSCFRQRNSLCKGPEAGMSLASFWISRRPCGWGEVSGGQQWGEEVLSTVVGPR